MAAYDPSNPAQDTTPGSGVVDPTRKTGAVTDPSDPRLTDPSYASDPNVLAFLNGIYGAKGTAQTPPAGAPGWNPTAQAWNATATPGPAATGGTTTTGGTLGDLAAPFTGTFTAPTPAPLPTTPTFTPPGFTPPPAFSYKDFTAPTYDEAQNDPGFQFALDKGNQAFLNNRAAAGVAGTGGTIKDFIDYNQNAGAQQYNSVFKRDLDVYGVNRQGALDTYNTNYKTQYVDPWNFADTAATQAFAPQILGYTTTAANTQHQNDVANTNAWDQYLQDFNIFDSQRKFINQGLQFSAGA